MRKFALIISSLTEPMVVATVLASMAAWFAGVRGILYLYFLLYLGVMCGYVTYVRIRFMKELHTNWDASERPKRVRLLKVMLGVGVFFIISLYVFHNPRLLQLSRFIFEWFIGFFLLTLWKKISGHMALFVLTYACFSMWFHAPYWPAMFLVPLVGWSRIMLKRHTLFEVVGGCIYSVLFLTIMQFLY